MIALMKRMVALKKNKIVTAVLALLFVVAIGVLGFNSAGKGSNNAEGKLISAAKADIQIATSADGRAVADSSVNLDFTTAGTVSEIYVTEGQLVKKGDKLAKLDTRKLSSQLSQAKAGYSASVAKLNSLKDGPSDAEVASKQVAVDNAKIAVADAQASYDYTLEEYNEGSTSKEQLLTKEGQLNNAKSQLKAAEAQLQVALEPASSSEVSAARAAVNQADAAVKVAEATLDEAVLRSPIDGLVLAINGRVGEAAGGQNQQGESFIVVGIAGRMIVEADVEEIDIAKIKVGQKVKATFDALEGKTFSGSVDSIAARANVDQNGVVTYRVRAVIQNDGDEIKDGMTAHADFIFKEATNVVSIPVKSVTRVNGKPSVVTQAKDGSYVMKAIEVGLTDGVSVEVKKGLSAGEKVFIKEAETKGR